MDDTIQYSVLKFGGKSFSTPELLTRVFGIIEREFDLNPKLVLVFSAFQGMTHKLEEIAAKAARGNSDYESEFDDFCAFHIQFARQVIQGPNLNKVLEKLGSQHAALKTVLAGVCILLEATPRTMDYILSFGEFNACLMVESYLQSKMIPVQFVDSRDLVLTDNKFGNATVQLEPTKEQVKRRIYSMGKSIPLVPGFTGATAGGLFTTLGKGSSDYTAALLASALETSSFTIWSTVDGILSADPERVSGAITIPQLSYAEALEMAQVGSRRIHHNAIQIAADSGIAIKLRNVINPDHQGTLIGEGPFRDQRKMIKGITLRPEVVQCEISGIGDQQLSEWLNELSKSELQPVLQFRLQGLETSSFVFEKHGLVKSQLKVLESGPGIGKKEFRYRDDLSLVSITGDEMANSPGVFGKMFEILGRNGINVISMAKGGGNQTLTALIPAKDSNKALNALHEGFFLSGHQVIHLFLAGTGLIGSTLLRQIKKQKFHLLQNRQLELRVVGLSNSRKMHFDLKGIDTEDWQHVLAESAAVADAKHFVDLMRSANLRNSIFIDCTPNSDFSSLYRDCLLSNISISTPNKLVASGPASTYRELKQIAQLQGVRFAFETNVGAGLPVINTLNDLLQSGDQILQIEGVLSGSLSYIFNQFQQGGTFSDAVQAARDAGLTEPDPRDDLFGIDFCRKLVILAREAGWEAELANVDMKPFLSEECLHSQSVEEFMQSLVRMNETMDKLRTGAAEQNKIIRIVGKVTPQHASLALEAVAASHPFYGLSGSDNMIVFTTERYQERPLVIRGPGAGAEVTAAGVFAEIISIANVL